MSLAYHKYIMISLVSSRGEYAWQLRYKLIIYTTRSRPAGARVTRDHFYQEPFFLIITCGYKKI